MIIEDQQISVAEFESQTGWNIKPEGACKGDICIPLSVPDSDKVDVESLASDMGLPIVSEPAANLWALGPESVSGRALTTADAIDFELPDVDGNRFKLSSLKGKKIIVYAWAPY